MVLRPHGRTVVGLVALGVTLAAVAGSTPSFANDLAVAASPSVVVDESLEHALLEATNAARSEAGLGPLTWDEGLARVARLHAAENAERNVLDHGSPNPQRDTPAERIGAGAVALVEIGENLAWMPGEDVAQASVEGWLGSPPHRRNLLDPDFTHVGFGTALGGEGTYVAQLFGVRPWERLSTALVPFERSVATLHVDVEGPAGVGGALFLDGRALTTFAFTGAAQRVSLDVPPTTRGTIDLAALVGPGRYQAVHAFELAPSGESTVTVAPSAPAWVIDARSERSIEAGFVASIEYRDLDPAWAVLVDGVHRPDAVADGSRLSVEIVRPVGPVEVAVGTLTSATSIRVLERFTLMPATGVLVPGRPVDDALQVEREAWASSPPASSSPATGDGEP